MLKNILMPACLLIALSCFFPKMAAGQASTPATEDDPFQALRNAIVDTGVVRDATPALIRPRYLSVSDASLSMEDNEVVFLAPFFPDGIMRIYPQRIMVWHEVVNEFFDETNAQPVAITYCPITGSIAAYNLHTGKHPITLGVSGKLLNNNSILYDHFSASSWPQLTGQCIDGTFKGRVLPRLPLIWTTWGRAKALYSEAKVLSRSTGFRRNYGKDPYGSYTLAGSYYDDLAVIYPLLHVDKRLHPKQRMHCLEFDGIAVAINKEEVKKLGAVNFTMGITPLVAAYDPLLDTVRVFGRELEVDGEKTSLTFSWADGYLVDEETRTEWSNEGKGILGKYRDRTLTQFAGVDCMWFAWSAFYPRTRIVPGQEF